MALLITPLVVLQSVKHMLKLPLIESFKSENENADKYKFVCLVIVQVRSNLSRNTRVKLVFGHLLTLNF